MFLKQLIIYCILMLLDSYMQKIQFLINRINELQNINIPDEFVTF